MSALTVPRAALEAMRAHAEEIYPRECCGVVLGRASKDGWEAVATLRAENASTDAAANHYNIAPCELVRIAAEACAKGLEIAGFYHSHPDGSAQWSATDLAGAHWIGSSYVIVSVAGGRSGQIGAFLLEGTGEQDKRFATQALRIPPGRA